MNDAGRRRYRAPALEKGLEVLELLSGESRPVTFAAVAERLGRSKSELFRVLQVLELENYIARDKSGDGYTLTNKLFMLGLERPPNRALVEAAAPEMRRLAEELQQSCHLVVASSDHMVVIHRVEASADLGFSVRVGYQRRLVEATSGLVLLAFGPEERRAAILDRQSPGWPATRRRRFEAKLDDVRGQGFAREASDFVAGITDLSAPLFDGDGGVAALTIPHVSRKPAVSTEEDALETLRASARRISEELTGRPVAD